MCRWITLISTSRVSLSDIILSPSNSLIQLSKDASYHPDFDEMNNHVTNGDGFGVGWYHSNDCNENTSSRKITTATKETSNGTTVVTVPVFASVFKDTQPAWNNINLRELCMAVKSNCMIAHVRAASVFAGISQQNCHPFKAGHRLLFCHNGRIGNFDMVRRMFHTMLTDEAYIHVKGTTDSETLFALLCTILTQDGLSNVSPYHQTEPFGHERLTNAVKKLLKTIEHTLEKAGAHDTNFSTLNFSVTDGETVVVTRFCDKSPQVPPPSLYFAFGDADKLHDELIDEDRPKNFQTQSSSVSVDVADTSRHSGTDDTNTSEGEEPEGEDVVSEYDEKPVETHTFESKPGTVYADIDCNSASFIVASNPLTKTHTWHPMPKNSIMWYTRGSLPELRLLKHGERKRSHSYILSSSWRLSTIQAHANN